MSGVVAPPAHKQVRDTLRNLAQELNSLRLDEFDLEQLETNNVQVDFITLEDMSTHQPSYFISYPSHHLSDPDLLACLNDLDELSDLESSPVERAISLTNQLALYVYQYRDEAQGEQVPWISSCVGHSAFEHAGLNHDEEPEFGCCCISDLDDPAYPHVKAVMYNGMPATDSTILYGELLPILRIMLRQLRRPRFFHQLVTPVLLFSFSGSRARVIEAFFNGTKLVLRPTELYDFTDFNHNAFKTFALWFIGKPSGLTTQTF